MELTHLRTFRVVADALNFTRAAQRLNLTQSAVSHQIKALEAELGEPLFVRGQRGVRLSEAGQVALDYAARILDQSEELRERLAQRERAPAGRVRAAAATQAFVHLFAPLFEDFLRAYPAIELTFRTTPRTDQTVADILSGAAEVGFASLPVYAPALHVTQLFRDELLLALAAGHRLAERREVTLDELGRERFILFEPGASIRRASDAFFARTGLRPELALESNDADFIKLMVLRGVGVSLLPAWVVRQERESGRLALVRVAGQRLERDVAAVSLRGFQPVATRAFLDFMLARREELQRAAVPAA